MLSRSENACQKQPGPIQPTELGKSVRTFRRKCGRLATIMAIATSIGFAACHPTDHQAVGIAGTDIPFDSVLPLIDTVVLQESPDHVIGNALFGTVARNGRVLLADAAMGDVKVFSRSGAFIRTLGRRGRGPGEFILPVSVAESPVDGRVAVTDLQTKTVTIFAGDDSLEYRQAWALASPVGVHAIALGRGDTLVVTGPVENPRASAPKAAAMMAGKSNVIASLLPVPQRMLHRAYLESFISGMVDQTSNYFYLELQGDGWLYRVARDGRTVDSLFIPVSAYPGFELPQQPLGSDSAVREYFKTQPMARAFRAMDDSTFLVEVQAYQQSERKFMQTMVLVRWNREPMVWTLAPCRCRLVGSRGDTVAFLLGEPPASYRVEWRVLRRPSQ